MEDLLKHRMGATVPHSLGYFWHENKKRSVVLSSCSSLSTLFLKPLVAHPHFLPHWLWCSPGLNSHSLIICCSSFLLFQVVIIFLLFAGLRTLARENNGYPWLTCKLAEITDEHVPVRVPITHCRCMSNYTIHGCNGVHVHYFECIQQGDLGGLLPSCISESEKYWGLVGKSEQPLCVSEEYTHHLHLVVSYDVNSNKGAYEEGNEDSFSISPVRSN